MVRCGMVNLLLVIMLLVVASGVRAQVFSEPVLVEICSNKTVSLVFPAAIVSTDRGSNEVMVQQAAENILKVKAAGDSCRETNLTVVTADHQLYSFIVRYHSQPAHLTIQLGQRSTVKVVNPWEAPCTHVSLLPNNIVGLKRVSGKVLLQVLGWYVQGSVMFCKLKIENRSQIGYDIERLGFYLADNHALRRTATQEIPVAPLLLQGDTSTIGGRTARQWVIAIPKFTIPDQKHFAIEIIEKNGGRHLSIAIHNRQLMQAKAF